MSGFLVVNFLLIVFVYMIYLGFVLVRQVAYLDSSIGHEKPANVMLNRCIIAEKWHCYGLLYNINCLLLR